MKWVLRILCLFGRLNKIKLFLGLSLQNAAFSGDHLYRCNDDIIMIVIVIMMIIIIIMITILMIIIIIITIIIIIILDL